MGGRGSRSGVESGMRFGGRSGGPRKVGEKGITGGIGGTANAGGRRKREDSMLEKNPDKKKFNIAGESV